MKHTKITKEDVDLANEMSNNMGTLNNSITKGRGNVIGFLGEIIVAKELGIALDNTYDYDLIFNNKKIDVKSKKVSSAPRDYYECSVAALNTKQKCDFYIFTRIKNDLSEGWILGCLEKEKYLEDSKFLKKGSIDPDNNWKVLTDCYNLPISRLETIEELIINEG
tara:strand:+ start:34 stop:528 length:495 start_codon:yes stop_codon:yes gene_type:complete